MPRVRSASHRRPTRPPRLESCPRTPRAAAVDAGLSVEQVVTPFDCAAQSALPLRVRRGGLRSGAVTPVRVERGAPRGRAAACELLRARSPAAGCRVSCTPPRPLRPARSVGRSPGRARRRARPRRAGRAGRGDTRPRRRCAAAPGSSRGREGPRRWPSSSAIIGAAPRRCSKLSRRRRRSRSRRKAPRSSGAPMA